MGAYITNETAVLDPITNPFGTHSHIGKYFTNIPKQYFSKQKWKSGGELDGKLYHPRKSGSRSNHQSIWNSYQAQYFTSIPKITSPEEGKQKCKYDLVRNRKTQLISTIEAPIHLDQRPSNAILVRPRLLIMTTKIFGLTKKKERYYAEISGISYITLWAIFFCKPCVELPTNQFLSKPSLMWRNFKKLSTLHGSQAPMVYSHEKQL